MDRHRGVPLPAPSWNQLDDPLPDMRQDPQAQNDCGEECCAMAIKAIGGPELPAGVLRAALGGPRRLGFTTPADLVQLLSLFHVRAHVRHAGPDVAWVEWIHSYEARFLTIALGYWVSQGFLHWVLIRQTDPANLTFNDPWGGHTRHLSKQDALKLYAGVYVHVDTPVIGGIR